jgi:hypothetical protein
VVVVKDIFAVRTEPLTVGTSGYAGGLAARFVMVKDSSGKLGIEAEAAPAPTTKMAERRKPIVKRKVVQVAHRRSFHGAYAQSNGWGWPGGGWGGQGPGFRF